jgi:hypothetical protein
MHWLVDRVCGDRGQIIKARAGDVAGTVSEGYRQVCIDSEIHPAHRVAWMIVHGRWPGAFIDHINGDKADNRLCNLREATASENNCNRAKPNTNTSGFKGVHLHRRSGKWKAQISVGGRRRHLGLFLTPEDAHAAYVSAAKEFYGQFAKGE